MTFGELLAQLVGWLGDFVQFIISFSPRIKIIRCTQRGVVYCGGAGCEDVGPGYHWYWPWRTEIVIHDVTRDTLEVEPIPLETADGVQVEVGLVIGYRVVDIVKYDAENFEPSKNIQAAAGGELCTIVKEFSWAQLKASSDEGSRLEKMLRSRMGKAMGKFGIDVETCRPNAQVRLRLAAHVFGNAMSAVR